MTTLLNLPLSPQKKKKNEEEGSNVNLHFHCGYAEQGTQYKLNWSWICHLSIQYFSSMKGEAKCCSEFSRENPHLKVKSL